MVNKLSIQAMKLIAWNVHCWFFLSQVFMSTALAKDAGFKENTFILKPSSSSIAQSASASAQSKKISIEELLKKYVRNGSSQLFDGTFVYLFENSLLAMKVKRERNEHGDVVEKFIPLDSNQKKSTRLLTNQYCILDNGWQYQFQAVSSSFPFRINNHYRDLKKNYDFMLSEVKTVAGTPVIGLTIKAKDPYRYGYKLWFEPDTATLLRYKLIDKNDKVIEQYLFTDITFSPDLENYPVSASEIPEGSLSCVEEFQGISSKFKHYFNHDKIPHGYEPVSFRKGVINSGGRHAYQFQLSDGIASVSIFIEEIGQPKQSVNGVVKLGPVNVAGKTVGEYQITVLGAIPVASALHFLKAIKEPVK